MSKGKLYLISFIISAVIVGIAALVGSCNRSYSDSYSSGSSHYSTSSFTNRYGTSTTKCAHPGCSSYIASSGDTNCCTTHSNRCLNCRAYIDEDATYCMSCLSSALK